MIIWRKFFIFNIFFLSFLIINSNNFSGFAREPLSITSLNVVIEGNSAIISWQTNQPTSGCVEFGLAAVYNQVLCAAVEPQLVHRLRLINLSPETVYHFRVTGENVFGEEVSSFDQIFKTGQIIDRQKPEIIDLNLLSVTGTTATLFWRTTEPASGEVVFGIVPDMRQRAGFGFEEEHQVTLRGLVPGTLYQYQIEVKDKAGNKTVSGVQTFRTLITDKQDREPLEIFNVQPIDPHDPFLSDTSATIRWQTNKLSEGILDWGEEPNFQFSLRTDKPFKFSHSLKLDHLKPKTKYLFRVRAFDIFGGSKTSREFTFQTKPDLLLTQPTRLVELAPNQRPRVLGTTVSVYTPAQKLVKVADSADVYAIINNQKHLLRGPSVFLSYGYRFDEVEEISLKKLDQYPSVRLVKLPDSPTVYFLYLRQGLRKPLASPQVFESYPRNRWQDIVIVSSVDLGKFKEARLVKLPDSPTVYFLKQGKRLPILSEAAFLKRGYNWEEVVIINEIDLNSYQLGEPLI